MITRTYRAGIQNLGDALAKHDAEHKRLSFVSDHAALATVDSEMATTNEAGGKQRRPSMVTRSVDLLWLSSKIDKFKSRAWWAGSFLIAMRIMQTSMMVFIVNPGLQATAASLIALVGVAVQSHAAPYRNPSDNHAALAAAWLLFLWSFLLLVRYSGAAHGENGVTLGVLLIVATVVIVMLIARALAADVKKYIYKDEHEVSSIDIGVELGAQSSAQVEPGEETAESTETGNESPECNVPSAKLNTSSGSWDGGYLQSIMCSEESAVDDGDAVALMRRIEMLAKELTAKDTNYVEKLTTMISMVDDSS